MTTYTMDKGQANVEPKFLPYGEIAVMGTYTFPSSSGPTLTANDVITGITVPAGAVITDVIWSPDTLDSGSVAVKFDIGDSATAARYFSQSTTGQAAGTARDAIGGGYIIGTNSGDNVIFVTVHTSGGGAVPNSAKARLIVKYTMDA